MPFKRKESPYYQIRKYSLVGYGDSTAISSGVTSKKVARDMERCLEEIAQMGLSDPSWHKLLDAICKEKTVKLSDMLAAKGRGELRLLKDTPLAKAVEVTRELRGSQKPVMIGLDHLLEYAPKHARLSVLRNGRTITEICRACESDSSVNNGEGRKRNTVRRQLLRAISHLLRHYAGNAERNRIFDDVDFPVRFTSRLTI